MSNGKPAATHHGSVQLASQNASPKPAIPSSRWHQVDQIAAVNWDRSYPYQLLVLRKQPDGSYAREPGWIYTFPIPPQALSMGMPVAVHGQVTLGGYVEQHGGVPIRTITLRGTTGVLPLRGSAPVQREFSAAQSIFAGTVAAARRVADAAGSLAQDVSPTAKPSNLLRAEDITERTDIGRTSGYYQWRLLYQLLERYNEAKLTERGRDLRMALANWKDEAIYLVTPINFELARQYPQVFEYPWTLTLRGFRRVKLSGQGPGADHGWVPVVRNPDAVARAVKALSDSRRLVAGSVDVLRAVVSDFDRAVLLPLREATLLLKDVAGIPASVIDVGTTAIQGMQGAVVDLVALRDAYETVPRGTAASSDTAAAAWDKLVDLGRQLARQDTAGADLAGVAATQTAALAPFADPAANHELFDSIRLGELRLPQDVQDLVDQERARVGELRREDLEDRRVAVRGAHARLAAAVGLGSAVLDDLYGRTAPTATRRATTADLLLLGALDDAVRILDSLAAGAELNRPALSALDAVAGLAARSGIAFTVPAGKRAVPLPAGWALGQVAARYLGDLDRWREIAALNGLRAPYVDEVGFDLPLVSPSDGPWLAVAPDPRLRAGERVYVASRARRRASGRILELLDAGDHAQVRLDVDVPGYAPADGATLHAWLPDTARSGQSIYLPVAELPPSEDYDVRGIVGVDEWDPMVRVAGIDWLLDSAGDLVVTSDGDAPYVTGLAALTQQVRIYLSLVRGSLARHPQVGLDVEIGQSIAELGPEALAEAARDLVADDPSFAGVRDVAVRLDGYTQTLAVSLAVRGWDQVLPAAVEVTRSGA